MLQTPAPLERDGIEPSATAQAQAKDERVRDIPAGTVSQPVTALRRGVRGGGELEEPMTAGVEAPLVAEPPTDRPPSPGTMDGSLAASLSLQPRSAYTPFSSSVSSVTILIHHPMPLQSPPAAPGGVASSHLITLPMLYTECPPTLPPRLKRQKDGRHRRQRDASGCVRSSQDACPCQRLSKAAGSHATRREHSESGTVRQDHARSSSSPQLAVGLY